MQTGRTQTVGSRAPHACYQLLALRSGGLCLPGSGGQPRHRAFPRATIGFGYSVGYTSRRQSGASGLNCFDIRVFW